MMINRGVKAIIWDFDDTIVKTLEKGLRKKRKIVEMVTGRDADEFPALRNLESLIPEYRKWKRWTHFYTRTLGLTDTELVEVNRLWKDPELKYEAPTEIYEGIDKVIIALKEYPQGIVSVNAHGIIKKSLEEVNLLEHFDCIVDYKEAGQTKPEPHGLILCIEKLTGSEPGDYVYIGDHRIDAETTFNANKHFVQQGLDIRIATIAAMYGFPSEDYRKWKHKPNEVVRKPLEIISAIKKLESGNVTTKGGVLVPN